MRSLKGVVLLMLLLCFATAVLMSQETTGTITGMVTDPTGSLVPNATVTVRNVNTGFERKVQAGQEGEYLATLLPIGTYSVTVEAPGFKKFSVKDITLNVNDRLKVNATLSVGVATEEVTVEANAGTVQTENSTVGSVVTGKTVTDMPLNGRSLYQLIALQPGVSAAGNIVSGRVGVGLDQLAQINVNGSRGSQNNWMLDGADNNDTGSNLATINYISVDSVSEFKILRSNYGAEFGRSAGGQINIITKSGTNSFHGGAFEFFRNDALDARNYFRPSCDTLTASGARAIKGGNCGAALLRYNNFGWNIGGPVKKDKLFFFYNEEMRRVRTVRGAGVTNLRMPTLKQRQGDFSEFAVPIIDPLTGTQFPGNVIPSDRIDSNARALLSLIPQPNVDPKFLNSTTLNYTTATPGGRNYREEMFRVDYNLSDKHRLYGRYVQDTIPSDEPFAEIYGSSNADFPGIANTHTNIPGKNLVTEWNWIPSATVVNNFSFNWSKGAIYSDVVGKGLRANVTDYKGIELYPSNPAGTLPGVTIGGYFLWGFVGPVRNEYGAYRWKDTLAWAKGKHSFKVGYLFSKEFKNENGGAGSTTSGAFNFPTAGSASYVSAGDGFANFLLGRASSYTESDVDIAANLRYNMHEAFIQDDWKVLPNFTLNFGVRWSYILPPHDLNNVLTNFDPSLFDPAKAMQIDAAGNRIPGSGDPLNGLVIAGKNSPYGDRVAAAHSNTLGPRFGFAWDPFKNGKTSIRGGYGIYFDRTLSGVFLQNAFANPPFVTAASFSADKTQPQPTPTFMNPAGGAARDLAKVVPGLTATDPNFKIPTTQQWSFGIQQDLGYGMTLDTSYVGNHGTHLLRALAINQTAPGAATSTAAALAIAPYRGWGAIRVRSTSASSRYDALQVGFKKQSKALTLGAAYTWSKVISDASSDRDAGDTPQWRGDVAAERALTNFDKSHIFVSNFMYELPWLKNTRGWKYNLLGGLQFGGLFRAESGTPLTITVSGTNANTYLTAGSVRPDLIGNPSGAQTVDHWFNQLAFAPPANNMLGNAPRSTVRGPGLWLADLTLSKNFKIREGVRLQFRADVFNTFNHTNWTNPSTTVGGNNTTPANDYWHKLDANGNPISGNPTPNFGRITGAREPRQIQLGLRFTF